MTEQLDAFMSYLARQDLGAATVQLYHGAVRRALENVSAGRGLTDILIDESLGASRRETYRKALFHWAAFQGDTRLADRLREWTPGRRPQRTKGEAKALDIELEWPQLRRAVLCHEDRYLAAVLYLLLTTGLRIAEVLNLDGEMIRTAIEAGESKIKQKGGGLRKFVLPTSEMRLQALLLADNLSGNRRVETLLTSQRRRKRKAVEDYVRRELQKLAAGLGISGKVGPHVCRRTVGDAIYESSDHDMRAVSETLGHKLGSRTTERWYQDHSRRGVIEKALGAVLPDKESGS